MSSTSIEWTDEVWNPLAGCSIKSTGCMNCYAMRQAWRFRNVHPKYAGTVEKVNGKAVWTGKLNFDENALLEPLSWKAPRRVFVNSMSDLFHESLTREQIKRVIDVIERCPQHQFQVLTKRAERMRIEMQHWCADPYPNLWLGVSVENQAAADERIPELLKTPAAVRFVSYEPALGPVDFQSVCKRLCPQCGGRGEVTDSESGGFTIGCPCERLAGLSWVIVGGESGPGARPFDIAWARRIAQCREAGVACFVKQLGKYFAVQQPDWCTARRKDRAGGDMSEWPKDLRVREFPRAAEAVR